MPGRRQASLARSGFLHAENIFGRQRRHRALQPAAIERVIRISSKGKLLAVWEDIITPWGLWLTKNDEIWVCGSSPVKDNTGKWLVTPPPDQILMKLNLKGKVLLRVPLQKTTVPPGKVGELNWVHSIAFDSQGNLYLGDIQGYRAQKFSPKP